MEKDACTTMVTAVPFTTARTWKQHRCPLTDEQIKKLRYINTMEYYSAIKRNALESVLKRWMNTEPRIQSEVSQKEKNKDHILTHIHGIQRYRTDKPICTAAVETQTLRTDLWHSWQGGSRGWHVWRALACKVKLPYVKQPMGICCMTQGIQSRAQ